MLLGDPSFWHISSSRFLDQCQAVCILTSLTTPWNSLWLVSLNHHNLMNRISIFISILDLICFEISLLLFLGQTFPYSQVLIHLPCCDNLSGFAGRIEIYCQIQMSESLHICKIHSFCSLFSRKILELTVFSLYLISIFHRFLASCCRGHQLRLAIHLMSQMNSNSELLRLCICCSRREVDDCSLFFVSIVLLLASLVIYQGWESLLSLAWILAKHFWLDWRLISFWELKCWNYIIKSKNKI